jgi:hypothetical protein
MVVVRKPRWDFLKNGLQREVLEIVYSLLQVQIDTLLENNRIILKVELGWKRYQSGWEQVKTHFIDFYNFVSVRMTLFNRS